MLMKLDKDLFTNKYHYFFSLLGPRFDAMNEMMATSLSSLYNVPFKPINIYSFTPNKWFSSDSYIVINRGASEVERSLKNPVVYVQEYEDLNKEFLHEPIINEIASKLSKKQGIIPVYPFTTSFLDLKEPYWLTLGPNNKIATFLDNKIEHYKLFRKLKLPFNKAKIYKDSNELLSKNNVYPGYITASYTSGGAESGLIYSKEMLNTFLSKLRNVNQEKGFVVATIMNHVRAMPNVNAVVTGLNKTYPLVVSDQIMRGNKYLGNYYPTKISNNHHNQILEITNKIGNYLSKMGYRGLFGCDFLIDKKGRLVIVDLNPRRQGGYECNALALSALGVNLTDIELACVTDNKIEQDLDYAKIQYPSSWAHVKIKPYEPGQIIIKELAKGNVQKIFNPGKGKYLSTYPTKGSIFIDGYIGAVVEVGSAQEDLNRKVLVEADNISSSILS